VKAAAISKTSLKNGCNSLMALYSFKQNHWTDELQLWRKCDTGFSAFFWEVIIGLDNDSSLRSRHLHSKNCGINKDLQNEIKHLTQLTFWNKRIFRHILKYEIQYFNSAIIIVTALCVSSVMKF